jgi:signal peptidase complex subunit 2
MGLLTLFMSYKEKNIFTVSVKTGAAGLGPKDYLYISSTLPRYSSEYSLSFEFIDGKTGTTISANLSKSISEWIDVSGDLNLEKFFNDIDKLHSDVTKKKQN